MLGAQCGIGNTTIELAKNVIGEAVSCGVRIRLVIIWKKILLEYLLPVEHHKQKMDWISEKWWEPKTFSLPKKTFSFINWLGAQRGLAITNMDLFKNINGGAELSGVGSIITWIENLLVSQKNSKNSKTKTVVVKNNQNSMKKKHKKFFGDPNAKKHYPALGEATISGLMVVADNETGLATKIEPIILGGSLETRI